MTAREPSVGAIKPCPFCGEPANWLEITGVAWCRNNNCGLRGKEVPIRLWQRRSIDAFAREAAERMRSRCAATCRSLRQSEPTMDGSYRSRNPARNQGLDEAAAEIDALPVEEPR